ncbi:MAG: oligosaccharide flippase family protein [Anaerolineales bacterium]|nr:oligosaccharide flippase family protein [Anaerolineales bacterium]
MSTAPPNRNPLLARLRNAVLDTALHRVARNTGWLLAAEVVATLVSAIQFPLVARLLGVEGYGTAVLVVGWVGLVTALLGMQTRKTIVKYLSLFLSEDSEPKALAIVKLALGLNLLLSTIIFVLLFIAAPRLSIWLLDNPDGVLFLRLVIVRDFLAATGGTTTSVLRVLDRFKWLSIFNAFSSIATFALVSAALLAGWQVAGYLAAMMVISAGQAVALYLACQHELRARFHGNWWQADLRTLRQHGHEIRVMLLSLKLDGLRKIATDKADVVILGMFADIHSVGLYKIAKQLAGYLSRVSNPIYAALYPEIARLYHDAGFDRLPRFIRQLTRWLVAGVGASVLLIVLLAGPLVPIVFGAEYTPALPLFYIMMLIHVWLGLIWAPGLLLTLGKTRQLTAINLASALILVSLLFVLAPTWGATGATIALVANYWAWTALVLWYLGRLPDIRLWARRTQSALN